METLKKMTDNQLVTLYAEGNNDAFNVLLFRYKNKVYSYIYFIVRNKEITEDIFQDTFIRVINTVKQGRYVDTGKFVAWVNRIAHNLIIDYFRHEKNENAISNDDCQDFDLFNNSKLSDQTIEDQLVTDQVYHDVQRLVSVLPQNQREVIQMRYYEGLSFKDIADKTNVSINTALGRMRYALLNIRKIAEEKGICLDLC
jgi:RNA polymerase sigma-70 factor (ECF subfamily)